MDQVISTISRIFRERYGTTLTIESTKSRSGSVRIISNNWNSPFVYSQTLRQVAFPIFNSKRELQAIATACPVQNKDAIVFGEMAQFLQLTVAEHIELQEKSEIQKERQLAAEKIHADPRKVLALRTRKAEAPAFQYKKISPSRAPSLDPLWILSSKGALAAQIAFSVHDWVNNWAFINAREIPDLVWADPQQWANFDQVTIFIPDVHELSLQQLKILEANLLFLKQNREQQPLVIVTSHEEIPEHCQSLKQFFKSYRANEKISARIQAHFLLFNYKEEKAWNYHCPKTNKIYYLPFGSTSGRIH